MILYKKLSKISFLKNSYVLKFLFVAFIGIHIPLIGLLFFILYSGDRADSNTILVFALLMTLMATAATLWVLKKLIKPIEMASTALVNYKENRTISQLPIIYNDEAGLLMRNIQESILESEKFISEKQDLIYLLSHDLKNFAGNPQSLASIILESDPSDSIKELAELIYQSSKQQFQYIDNFIKLLKEQDEIIKRDTSVRTIEFKDIVLSVQKLLSQLLLIKKIKLNIKIEVTTANLNIEEELLLRVIVNLVDNAIKFSFPETEILLHIFQENKKISISVSDSGIGFEESYKEELFKKFTKMSKLGTANETSTGIGLYLCRKIIEKSNGELIAISPGLNQGAIFRINFN